MENNRQYHFRGKIVDVASDLVTLPNGQTQEIDVVFHPGGAAVIALDDRERVCLLRQYRVVFDDWFWELPAGKIDEGEAPLKTAQRELQEEAGVTASQWDDLGYIASSPGVFTEKVHLYLARDLTQGRSQPEPHELFEVHWLSTDEALDWCYSGRIVDAKTLAGLFKMNNLVKGSGSGSGIKK